MVSARDLVISGLWRFKQDNNDTGEFKVSLGFVASFRCRPSIPLPTKKPVGDKFVDGFVFFVVDTESACVTHDLPALISYLLRFGAYATKPDLHLSF